MKATLARIPWSAVKATLARIPWSAVKATLARIPRSAIASLLIGLLVGTSVLIAMASRGEQYAGRVGLLAQPIPGNSDTSPYGEVVSLTLPALVELARSPSVLQAAAGDLGTSPEELADGITVELVPASALVLLSVRAPTARQAAAAVSAIAHGMINADLLAPAGRLRMVDERPEITRIAPDSLLAYGLALAASVVAGLTTATVFVLRRARTGEPAVRAALRAAGVAIPVLVVREDDAALVDRLTVLCAAATRPARVVAVVPDLAARAEALAQRLPDKTGEPGDGDAVIAMVHRARPMPGELATVVGLMPDSSVLVAVVLA